MGRIQVKLQGPDIFTVASHLASQASSPAQPQPERQMKHAELPPGTSAESHVALLKEQLASVIRANTALAHALQHERFTVIRPIMRRGFRAVKRLSGFLPPRARNFLRAAFYEAISGIAPKSNLASQYEDFKRATNYVSAPTNAFTVHKTASTPSDDPFTLKARAYEGNGIDIFVFPIIDWHFRIQRPQHISQRLARRGYRIFYFSTTFLPATDTPFRVVETPEEGVFLCQISCPTPHPVIYSGSLTSAQQTWLAQAICGLHDLVGTRPALALLHLPFWRPLAAKLPVAATIYDCMDYHAGFSNTLNDAHSEEHSLIVRADLVVTSSAALLAHVDASTNTALIRNGADVDFFATPTAHHTNPRSSRPTVGYFGAIADWFDTELVAVAAKEFECWDFVLIGSTAHADITELRALPNVKLLGELPYGDLPKQLELFDICIIPFKLNDLILHTNPVKIYEYLSAGKPVVATPLPELQLLDKGLVHLAGTHEAFLKSLTDAMSECGDLDKAGARKRWAAGQTWDNRADQFSKAISSCLPRISVVVLCYNNLTFTKACLSSLEQFTLYPNWELVLVDNASQDDTANYLRDYAKTRSWVRVLCTNRNLGFSGGNNFGLKDASGEYFVLLNNDTFVTRNWLAALVRHLRRDPALGLVGPVTNNIGNEAKIDISYKDMDEMTFKALAYTQNNHGNLLYVDNIAFFCVAFSREMHAQVGSLDESFGYGFFEDDDYCKRAQLAGYKIAIAEDVFVHHHLSASFDSLGKERRNAIFEQSRKVYERKWGQWHGHRPRAKQSA